MSKKKIRKNFYNVSILRNLSRDLIYFKVLKIKFTQAKMLKSFFEKIITKVKSNMLHNKRMVISKMGNNKELLIFIKILSKRYLKNKCSCIRIIKNNHRKGDCALMSVVHLI